jgi:uncharacterized protein (TIGR01244 family)
MRMSWLLVLVMVSGLAACKKDGAGDSESGDSKAGEAQVAPTPQPTEPAGPALAELDIPNAVMVSDTVVSGGQVTDEPLAKAKEMGVTTVVNLRAEGERAEYETEQARVEELGMTYVHIPIDPGTGEGLSEENARKLAEIVGKGEPTIVHCKSGQRVGALFAMKAHHVDGKSPEEALEAGKQAGLSAPPIVELVSARIGGGAAPASQ